MLIKRKNITLMLLFSMLFIIVAGCTETGNHGDTNPPLPENGSAVFNGSNNGNSANNSLQSENQPDTENTSVTAGGEFNIQGCDVAPFGDYDVPCFVYNIKVNQTLTERVSTEHHNVTYVKFLKGIEGPDAVRVVLDNNKVLIMEKGKSYTYGKLNLTIENFLYDSNDIFNTTIAVLARRIN